MSMWFQLGSLGNDWRKTWHPSDAVLAASLHRRSRKQAINIYSDPNAGWINKALPLCAPRLSYVINSIAQRYSTADLCRLTGTCRAVPFSHWADRGTRAYTVSTRMPRTSKCGSFSDTRTHGLDTYLVENRNCHTRRLSELMNENLSTLNDIFSDSSL
jgi:hypothetical protein